MYTIHEKNVYHKRLLRIYDLPSAANLTSTIKGKKECRKSIIPTANICDSSYYCLIFRVKGISGLRIVDGSVMRSETGNINAPIIMIAEKVSDLIRGKNTGESFTRQIRSLDL